MENQKLNLPFKRKIRKAAIKVKDAAITNGKQNIIIIAALVALALIFYALNPNFLDRFNVVSMTQSLAPYAILALGVTFVVATGGIDLSIGTVCIASAVISGFCYMKGMPLWLTIPMMIVIGGLFGLLNGFLVAKLKLPAFIATLGTMMLSRGLSALIVSIPNIFFPSGTWFNSTFSNLNGFPIGLVWVIGLMLLCMYLMYKNKVGRYILSIGSNEEATRLSGINTDKYKMLAYVFCGIGAGIAAIFWSASFTTVASATGNGMELDAIAGVYIGGTSAAGGVASIAGSVIGNIMLVVIRSGLNFVLAKFNLNMNSTYVTYVLTGIIVVAAVLMDTIKNKNAMKVKEDTPKQKVRKHYVERKVALNDGIDAILVDGTITEQERTSRVAVLNDELTKLKADYLSEMEKLKSQSAKA
ncbi:MAG: ABC transporter permease [Candidatus Borkfalkiaceae bacterium]|nr:ABC transporter permease [Christensenellaceae bacterium]